MAQTHRTSGGGTQRVTGWVGWVLFAAVIMFTAGFINIIEGLVALFKDDYYQVRPSGLVLKVDYTTWGWTLLIFGVWYVWIRTPLTARPGRASPAWSSRRSTRW